MANPVSATGVSGMLIYGCKDYYLRVTAEDGTYKDYDIEHFDLSITITDTDAFFYPKKKYSGMDGVIDYSPATLGLDPLEEQVNADFAAMREGLAAENIDLKKLDENIASGIEALNKVK